MLKTIRRFPAGEVQIPPSKSVIHRAMICNALAGALELPEGFSEDLDATARCMLALTSGEREPTLNCGESGSTLRFLLPVAAAMGVSASFRGAGRLLERPLTPYLDELRRHGAQIVESADELRVSGTLTPGVFELPGDISSQFVTGLLLALPLLDSDSEIRLTSPLESVGYVGLTIDELLKSGVEIRSEQDAFFIRGNQRYTQREISIEGDFSHAAVFLAAGALGREVECLGLNLSSKQGDMEILNILKSCGINVVITSGGGLKAKPGKILPCDIDATDIPDLIPPVAAMLCFARGVSRIYNAGRLRYKESDRFDAIREELCKLGARVVADGDTLVINGREILEGGEMDSRGDHRIAMMGAVAAIRCRWEVIVDGAECVAKSYPRFWTDFEAT